MNKIAQFTKVSKQQFEKDWLDCFPELKPPYDKIKIPVRATKGSAGYDFCTPVEINLKPGESIKFPTGIRAEIMNGWVLMLYPRSSIGFKHRIQLNNTVAVIDSDYFHAKNEGHIFIKLANMGNKDVHINAGDGVVQGVFVPFGITTDDDPIKTRTGGLGSTDNQ